MIPSTRTLWYIAPDQMARESEEDGPPPGPVPPGKTANLVSSKLEGLDLHSPVLDIDFEARLIPSRTPGHFHLYLDGLALDWHDYADLLEALAKAGVIGPRYAERSLAEGMTVVRRPPVENEPPPLYPDRPPKEEPW